MTINCPFYGRIMYVQPNAAAFIEHLPFILLESKGNQCGLVRHGFAPCAREVCGDSVDWRECIRVKDIRLEAAV